MACKDLVGGYDEDRFEDKVDSKLLCPICLKVLKDPVQCPNQHYFCLSCLRKHLEENSETCPMCQHHLTEKTLTEPPRILLEFVLSLKIRCNHVERGCRKLIKLEFLDRHLEICGYSPTSCTNQGCSQVINRSEKERHESELCRFRKIVTCDECGQEVLWKSSRVHACFMRKEMDDLAKKLNVFQKDMSEVKDEVKQMKLTQEEFIKEVRSMMVGAGSQDKDNVVDDLRRRDERMRDEMRAEMRAEMASHTKETTERCDLFTGRQKVFVCGGRDENTRHNTVESYSWPENSWTLEPAMKEERSGSSAFVHERQIFVAGGYNGIEDTDSIESLAVDEEHAEWTEILVKMPIKCGTHRMISHENKAILTGGISGGNNISDRIYEIQLNPPYATKLLTQMPEPRYRHGCEIIDNQIVIAGGRPSTYHKDAKNTVYSYDINNNECKLMAPLPFAIAEMATVCYKSNVILIGGVNEKGQTLNRVIMYDLKTGKITMLPDLNHRRATSAAVITGNLILVMGGYDYETKIDLDSVECLDFNTNVWRELSPMTTKRSNGTAILKPF